MSTFNFGESRGPERSEGPGPSVGGRVSAAKTLVSHYIKKFFVHEDDDDDDDDFFF